METRKNKIVFLSAIGVALIALVLSIMYFGKFKSSTKNLDEVKLDYEKLLAEKLNLEKDNLKLQNDNSLLIRDFNIANSSLSDAERKIKELENQLSFVNNQSKKNKSLESQILELQKTVNKLNEELDLSNSTNAKLSNRNKELSNTIAELEEKISTLNQKVVSAMFANNYRVESLKGKKDKLTISAKKTKKVIMSFDIPQDITTNIQLKIHTPEGKIISGGEKFISWKFIETNTGYLAAAVPYLSDIEVNKRIEITYKPNRKLTKGIYLLEFFDNDKVIGNCQIRLK